MLYDELSLQITLWGLTENKGPYSLVLHLHPATATAASKALGGKKINSNERRKVLVILAGNTCREGRCFPVASKAVLHMYALCSKKLFLWAEWRNKVNLGGDEIRMHFRRLPTRQ